MAELYKITSPSGKMYFGISNKSTQCRWKQHRYNANKNYGIGRNALYDAIRKYGAETFSAECLVVGAYDYVKELEIKAISIYNSKSPNGYNLSDGGEGAVGVIVSAETRAKQSIKQKMRLLDPIQNKSLKDALNKAVKTRQNNWYKMSIEERATWSALHAERLRNANRFTPEVRALMSEKAKGSKKQPWAAERKLAASIRKKEYWNNVRTKNERTKT